MNLRRILNLLIVAFVALLAVSWILQISASESERLAELIDTNDDRIRVIEAKLGIKRPE